MKGIFNVNSITPYFMKAMPVIGRIAIVLIVYIIVVRAFNKIWRHFIIGHNELHWRFVGNIIRVLITVIALSVIGSMFTVTKEISVALFSGTGIVVAILLYTAQELLKNVIAGLAISFSKPYHIGSVINVVTPNISGIVEDITLRHTVVKCYDNTRLIVPNSIMNSAILSNRDYDNKLIGNYIEIGISYNSDIRKAKELMREIVINHPLVLDSSKDSTIEKHCSVLIKEFAESSIILKTTVWTETINDNFSACDDIRLEIKEAFDANGIVIPFATRTVEIVDKREAKDTDIVETKGESVITLLKDGDTDSDNSD